MVHVKLASRELNDERTAYVDVVRVELTVQGRELEVVSGDPSWLDLEIPILDAETGRSLRFEDDPEAWARRLPDAYRSGDVVATVDEIVTTVDEVGLAVGVFA
jgi:hypothetical protein